MKPFPHTLPFKFASAPMRQKGGGPGWRWGLIWWLWVFPLFVCQAQPQKLTFEYLNRVNGLPDDGVEALLQDQQGYIWMGTLNGLVRYDGYAFKVFRATAADSSGRMPVGRSFTSLLLDHKGDIWAATLNSGFSCYHTQTERFSNFPNETAGREATDFPQNELLRVDSKNRVWMYGINPATRKARLKCYDPAREQITYFALELNLKKKVESSGLLLEDQQGRIWAHQGSGGVYRLDDSSHQFMQVLSCDSVANTPLRCSHVQHLMLDTSNQLWISTDRGLHIYDINKASWKETDQLFPQFPLPAHQSIYYSYQDQAGAIWIFAEGEGLLKFEPDSQTTRAFTYQLAPFRALGPAASSFIIRPVMEDQAGIWWMNDTKKLAVFNRKFFYYHRLRQAFTYYGETFHQPDNQPNEMPRAFLMDRSGLMWIGNLGGVNRQTPLAQRIDRWDFHPSSIYGLATDSILSVQEDSEQQIWIMGNDKIQRFDPLKAAFEAYQPPKTGPQNRSIVFNRFQEDAAGNLWIGSNKGLYKFHKASHQFQLMLPLNSEEAVAITPELIDKQGRLWVKYLKRVLGGEYGFALGIVELHSGKLIQQFKQHATNSTLLAGNVIIDMMMDSKGRMWVGTFTGGLWRYEPDAHTFISYQHQPEDSTSLSNNAVSFVFEDSKAHIWVGTYTQGLNRYVEETDNFRHWKNRNGFLAILCAQEGKNGDLWFGTDRGEGLFNMQADSKRLSFYNKQNGLASDRVPAIIEDDFGYLWIPSEGGISRFNPYEKSSVVFGTQDGFMPYMYEHVPQYARPFKASNGDIWLNTYTSLFRIQPQKLMQVDAIPPQVLITSLKIGDQTYSGADGHLLSQHISHTASLTLAHDQNDLTFEFLGLHYARPADNQYACKLEGFDTHWSSPSHDRKARYAGLPPGTYTFRVRASNADGVWNEAGASIQLTIAPPWWETAWAYLAYFMLLLAGTGYFIRWRTRKQAAKIRAQEEELARQRQLSERLRALDRLKDQFIANTSHELRTPLNGIIGLSEGVYERVHAAQDKADLELVISSGKRLHYLVDDLLDFAKLKNGEFDIQQTALDLNSVVSLILRMSRPAAENKHLQLLNEIPDDLPAVLADPHRLQQILYNLVGNAIKFTDEGEVRVGAEADSLLVKVWVSDTGPGIPKDKQAAIFEAFQQADGSISRKFGGTGLGLSITKQLVELHGGRVWVESEVGQGSTFWFSLPATQETGEVITTSQKQLGTLSQASSGQPVLGTPATESLAPPMPAEERETERLRILIVDDEPVNQRVMQNHLHSQRFELAFANDGNSALAIMEQSPMFDLVLLDVMMPNMSGYEVCKKIREKYLPSELPIIMVTAKNQVTDLVQGLSKGANDYLAKPFSKQEFLARVKTQLDLHHIFHITDRFIPNEFIRTLGHERITEVQLGDAVEKVVSVLFTDIRNYTTLSEAMTPADNFRFISGYTNRMGPIIRRHRGFVNQYLGDGIMAIFQYEAEDALQAMIDMQEKLRAYNEERRQKGRPPLAVGMGLHTGPLMMGIIGDSHRSDAATISDTVNTASRMEGLTKNFGARILISESTHGALRNPEKYHFRYIGKVRVKGKQEAVAVYECIDGDPEAERAIKWKLKEGFDIAVTHFYGKKYEEAFKLTKQILQKNPQDQAARYFHQSAQAYLQDHAPGF